MPARADEVTMTKFAAAASIALALALLSGGAPFGVPGLALYFGAVRADVVMLVTPTASRRPP